jgi:nicotinamide-nucleotide amidase
LASRARTRPPTPGHLALSCHEETGHDMDKDLIALAHRVGDRLKARRETVAVAESSTGGLIAAALLAVPGASAYFLGGAVVYTPKARHLLMELPKEAVAGMRSASEPYARLLALRSRERFRASWGISETGASGPTGNPYGDPAGHSCLAVVGSSERVLTLRTGSSDRLENMIAFSCASLRLFEELLA